MSGLSETTRRKFLLVSVLARLNRPTIQDLYSETGIAIPSLRRHLQSLRDEYKLSINFVQSGGGGGKGYYVLMGWGVLDRQKFMAYYGRLGKE